MVLALFAILSAITVIRLSPVILRLAFSNLTDAVTFAVNTAMTDYLSDENVDYDSFVELETDNSGHITALKTNMSAINTLQTYITNKIISILEYNTDTTCDIPIGSLLGGTLFSNTGPVIPVRIAAVSSVNSDYNNLFSEAGINQTRHQIILTVDVNLDVLISGKISSITVPTEVVVAETIIVGDVPNYMSTIE
ncbi:MAG: sporulation protein YunB [Oscillospiraceae bacterium]|nr:sporulation protein YunB [Oscillospiraceae bacterium]